ncbi:MAG: cytochrome c-type biogenesis protein CcmH [Polyangiaceae bacterium]
MLFALVAAAWLALAGGAQAGEPAASSKDRLPGEAALLGRLMAPCCWTQTLDVHAGSTPDALRAEVHARLSAGESARAIEDDFVARYGPRIRAEAPESPLRWISVGLGALALGAALGLGLVIRRWTQRSKVGSPDDKADSPVPLPARDEWDERLDDELRALQ